MFPYILNSRRIEYSWGKLEYDILGVEESAEWTAGKRFQMELLSYFARLELWPDHPWGPSDKWRVGPYGSLSCLEGATSAALAIYVLRRFSAPSSFLSETHCFYIPSNLGVSLVSLTVILIYIILVFCTIRNIFYWLSNKWGGGSSYFHTNCASLRCVSWLGTGANAGWLVFIPPIWGLCASPHLIFH